MNKSNHWLYFLSLEREFTESLRYIELTDTHLEVYSFELMRLLILTCSELDVVLKVACKHIDKKENPKNIHQYGEIILKKYVAENELVTLDRYNQKVTPFKDWTNSPLQWWKAHNAVKHQRHEEFEQATLGHTMNAICGLFVANLILLNEINHIGNTSATPLILRRDQEPGVLLLEQGYRVELR